MEVEYSPQDPPPTPRRTFDLMTDDLSQSQNWVLQALFAGMAWPVNPWPKYSVNKDHEWIEDVCKRHATCQQKY